jgi:hypothetical protein
LPSTKEGGPPESALSGPERPDVLRTSPIETRKVEEVMEGLRSWINPLNGFRVIDLEFKADPEKRTDAWITQARQGLPTAEWNREFGSQWIVYDGKPVYQDFDAEFHVIRGTIVAPRRARLISGWDAGPNDVNLGWALGLTAPGENRCQIIDYYFAEDGDIADFVQVVHSRLSLEWVKLGGFSLHIADQSVFTKSMVADGRAVADIMRQHGMPPIAGEISFAKRRSAVEKMLKQHSKAANGRLMPSLMVHERCDHIIEAFQGGYSYGRSQVIGGHTFKETPLKNRYSHVMNAVEYICSRLELVSMEIPYEGKRLPQPSLI